MIQCRAFAIRLYNPFTKSAVKMLIISKEGICVKIHVSSSKFYINTIKCHEFAICLYKPFRKSIVIIFCSGKLGNTFTEVTGHNLLRRTGYWLDKGIEILPQNEVESAPEFFFPF